MRALIVLVLAVLVGCTAMVQNTIHDPGVLIEPKRHLTVAIFAQTESDAERVIPALREGFERFAQKTGIELGATLFVPLSMSSMLTSTQIVRAAIRYSTAELGPDRFDIGVVYINRLLVEDVFAVLAGVKILSGVDAALKRFIMLQTLSPSIVEHELGHIFGAADSQPPEENLRIVMANKWQPLDCWCLH